jgi:hypothetical protein
MLLSRNDAAKHLGVSLSTIDRMVKAGKITSVPGPTTNFGKPSRWFEFKELDPEPAPEPSATKLVAHPESESCTNFVQHPQSNVEEKLLDDFHFAHRFLQGEVTDSFGNTISATSADKTALGPAPPVERKPVDTTGASHINPALLANTVTIGTDGQPVEHAGSLNHPLLRGFKGVEVRKRPEHPNARRNRLLHVSIRHSGVSR